MIGEAERTLTDKQRDVLERIDRRLPIKLIASEMGVSETRINQHIRALKDVYEVGSLNELVERFREEAGDEWPEVPLESGVSSETEDPELPYRNSQCSKKQLPAFAFSGDQSDRDDPGSIRLSDAHVVARDAPWAHEIEPAVVFGALNGKNAVLYRLAVIIGLSFGMIAAVVLVVSAALSLSEVLEGKASIPADKALERQMSSAGRT